MRNVKLIFTTLFITLIAQAVFADNYAGLYDKLKTLAYNNETSTEEQVKQAYQKAYEYAAGPIEEAQLDYLIGLYYMRGLENNAEASKYFFSALEKSEKVFKEKPTAESLTIYAETLSQNCTIQNTSYLLKYAPKIPGHAKKALKLDPKVSGASLIHSGFYTYAPFPFMNLKKGRKILLKALENSNFEPDDYFNVYCTLGYIETKLKNFEEADKWHALAAKIYPDNKLLHQQMKGKIQSYGEGVDTSGVSVEE